MAPSIHKFHGTYVFDDTIKILPSFYTFLMAPSRYYHFLLLFDSAIDGAIEILPSFYGFLFTPSMAPSKYSNLFVSF